MKIGNVEFSEPFVSLAPLAGYGDAAFRRICREYGASLTVTEMVSVKGLCYGNEKTEFLLKLAPCEKPSCVQLFGSEPEFFYKALQLNELKSFDIIDINMGCPVPKVTKCGDGSSLMKDIPRAADVVRACIKGSGGKPVTVKHRLGISPQTINAPEFAYAMEQAGAAAITVHGRTVTQGYSGKADWDMIAKVVKAVNIPVIGNGDVSSVYDASQKMRDYGCSGIAIGRAALGHPDIFSGSRYEPLPNIILKHLDYALTYLPPEVAALTMRKHICRYLSGVPATKDLRAKINTLTSIDQIKAEISTLRNR